MSATPYETAISGAATEVGNLIGDSWPLVIASVVGLLGFKYFRRAAR